MLMRPLRRTLVAISLFITLSNTSAMAEDIPYIAGTNPSERPANAPVITEVKKDAAWYQKALHGVTEPYPSSLHFLENQGNWFTPFNHAGMTGRYDIRGWHHQ